MDRRSFIQGVGGLVAVSALPAFGADDPAQFASRGRFERLMLAYRHIDIGLPAPFSVLHISDTHLTAASPHEPPEKQALREERTRTFGGRQEEALADSLAWAKANADYVLHTGDLIDWQSEANFDLVRRHYGAIALGTMGNHEFSPSMWRSVPKEEPTEAWKDRSRAALSAVYPFDISFHAQTVRGVNFVMLDDVYGTVTARQVERFAAEVRKGLPIVLCLHVPFFTEHIWRANEKFWRNPGKPFSSAAIGDPRGDYRRQLDDAVTRDFIASLRGERLLKGILAGHLHIAVEDGFSTTAMQYVVGGNFMFHGQEILFT